MQVPLPPSNFQPFFYILVQFKYYENINSKSTLIFLIAQKLQTSPANLPEMFLSLSMARGRQITNEQRKARTQRRKANTKKAQWKNAHNSNFYQQVSQQIFDLKKYGPVYFHFPQIKEPFEHVKSIQQFKKLFEYQKSSSGINIDIKILHNRQSKKDYRFQSVKIFCKQCGPKMIMRYQLGSRTNNQFKLAYFDNSHHHQKDGVNQNLQFRRRLEEVPVKKRQFYSKDQWKQLFDQVYQKSKQDKMYYLKHPMYKYLTRFRRIYSHFKYQVMEMNYLNWKYWFEPDFDNFDPRTKLQPSNDAPEESPDFFMMIHPEMKSNFQRYGGICYLNIIQDGIIRKKLPHHAGIKFWEIISFTGLTQQNRFAPYCFVFLELAHHSPQNIAKIAKKFFNILSKTPDVIITPNDPFFDQTLVEMRKRNIFQGEHFYDPICQLQRIAKVIQNPDYFKYFYNLVQSTSPAQYRKHLQQLYRKVKPTVQIRQLLTQFQKKTSKMCFSQIKTQSFIGLTFQYSGNKYMNNYYKWNFIQKWQIDIKALNDPTHTYTNKYDLKEFIFMIAHQISRMFQRGINYIMNKHKYQGIKYQDNVQNPQLKKVRYTVKYDIFNLILKEYGKTVELEMRSRRSPNPHTPQMAVFDVYDQNQKSIFVVAPQPEYTKDLHFKFLKWRCGCMYSYKSGLPCCHQLKVALQTQTSLFDQINQYWVCQNTKKKSVYRINKKTRMNKLK